MKAPVHFQLQVVRFTGGYTWLETGHLQGQAPEPMLVAKVREKPGIKWGDEDTEVYNPLERESALFRIFADTEPTRDGIVAFADQYGHLFGDRNEFLVPLGDQEYSACGDPLDAWQENIWRMRYWVQIWDATRRGTKALAKTVTEVLSEPPKGEPQRAAFASVRVFLPQGIPINSKEFLTKTRQSFNLGFWETDVRQNMSFQVQADDKGVFRLVLRGDELSVALWAQFALAVVNDTEYRNCDFCGKPFEVSPEVFRTNRQYCSHSCRLKAYRQRQREAVKLKDKGWTPKQIADELKSDVKTVRGWLKVAQEKDDG
jgi:hypothetical protein